MPNGEIEVMGGQVIIEKIGREDGGEYECWNMLDNTTTTHKYVNVLCKLDLDRLKCPYKSSTSKLYCEVMFLCANYRDFVHNLQGKSSDKILQILFGFFQKCRMS